MFALKVNLKRGNEYVDSLAEACTDLPPLWTD
jgi:hypothetical protein